jgi:acid phosphatase (class A)
MAVMHFKLINNRRRPSQVCPALNPPVTVPGHASYPSGHSTQAMLMAATLGQVFEGKTQNGVLPAVRALAERIAVNREIAGLHYASDTAAGRLLAEALLPILKTCERFNEALADARLEWS